MDTLVYGAAHVERYNSAGACQPQRRGRGRYDKMRPIMFGEYIPLGSYFPWLYRLTPLADGLDPGDGAQIAVRRQGPCGAEHLLRDPLAAFHSRPGFRAARRGATSPTCW